MYGLRFCLSNYGYPTTAGMIFFGLAIIILNLYMYTSTKHKTHNYTQVHTKNHTHTFTYIYTSCITTSNIIHPNDVYTYL